MLGARTRRHILIVEVGPILPWNDERPYMVRTATAHR
jgi:hypothetical protein